MIIWGWGKVTKKRFGGVFQRTCGYCNATTVWQLCIIRTWFTLFFIPIIPYKKMYCITCPNCGSYIQVTKENFEKIKHDIENPTSKSSSNDEVEDSLKYPGKTQTQINYLKQMEEHDKNKVANE